MSVYARRRIAATLLLVGVVIAALAIADLGPFDDPPTEEEHVQEAVERFFRAADERDFETFCDLLTERAEAQVEQRAAAAAGDAKVRECPRAVGALIADRLEGVSVVFKHVNVVGPQARVEANLKFEGERGNEPQTVTLEQVDGTWLVSDFQ